MLIYPADVALASVGEKKGGKETKKAAQCAIRKCMKTEQQKSEGMLSRGRRPDGRG